MYANGSGNISSVPIIDDHLPVTISTVNTNDILTMDMETKPSAKRRIIYGISVFSVPSVVPAIFRMKVKKIDLVSVALNEVEVNLLINISTH